MCCPFLSLQKSAQSYDLSQGMQISIRIVNKIGFFCSFASWKLLSVLKDMNKIDFKKIIPHLVAVLVFIIASFVYFSPVLNNKQLAQSDMGQFDGMSKSLIDYHKSTGDYSEWTNSMFSGMPAYQLVNGHNYNILEYIAKPLTLGKYNLSAGVFFLLALGFYIFMVSLRVNPWMSIFAGLIYALGSYNIIIIGVGHITKAWAMSMMAPVFAGMILVFEKKYIKGLVLFCLALGLQISFNHIQITYYTLIVAIILGISYFVFALKKKEIKDFAKSLAFLLIGAIIALMPSTGHILVNQEYVKHTMRGGSELTIHHGNAQKNNVNDKGLDINYAYSWSYGKAETMTLLIPDYKGGGSSDFRRMEYDSPQMLNRSKLLAGRFAPEVCQQVGVATSYFGTQPFTAGPVYFGAIVIFLSLLGFIIIENKYRWWLLVATIVSVLLSWGNNFMILNEWLFYHLPLYNKFRTPSMALVIANVTLCIVAFLGLKAFFEEKDNKKRKLSLYISGGITLFITLLCAVVPDLLTDFHNVKDASLANQIGSQENLISAIEADRRYMFVSDSWRSFIFIALAFLTLLFFVRARIKKQNIVFCIIGIFAVIDLWVVDKRYVNNETNYQSKYEALPTPSKAESDILDVLSKEKPSHYRVYNMAVNTFNDASTSYFFPSIGGYSAAKLQRYQDVIDFYFTNTTYKQKDLNDTALLYKNPLRQVLSSARDMQGFAMPNLGVLNMLDTRFVIVNQNAFVENTERCGAAWFANNIKWVNNPNEEILALDNFDAKQTAVVNREFAPQIKDIQQDSTAKITFEAERNDNPTRRVYHTNSKTGQLAVFSEIYYKDSWKAYIDGKEVPYLRANYVLRALYVPQGVHKIEFVCKSDILTKAKIINFIGSALLVLLICFAIFQPYVKKRFNKKSNKEN